MATELTPEQLQGVVTDPEQETKVAQGLGIPQGSYNSVPELSVTRRAAGEDATHPGRQFAHVYGFYRGYNVKEDDTLLEPQPQGRAGFDLSWQYRDKVDFETKEAQVGKPDNQSKLWHQACAVYRVANLLHRKAVVEVNAVLNYIQKYSIGVRFIYLEGRDEPLAVAITRARE